jgi:hypothetical protein
MPFAVRFCCGIAGLAQFPEAPLGIQELDVIVRIEVVAAVASVVHDNEGVHVPILTNWFAGVDAFSPLESATDDRPLANEPRQELRDHVRLAMPDDVAASSIRRRRTPSAKS